MDEGLLSLKWNNHKSTFFHILGVLREKQTYTDVTLACEGKLYPAHKFVLSTCSEYFNEIFNSTSGNSVVIVLKDVRRQDLEYLLDYMYLGEVDVAQTELASLIKTAECLRIKGLAIPDDEPPRTSRKSTSDGHERGQSPPSKKRRRPSEEDRQRTGSVNSTNSSSSRISQGGPSLANSQTHATPSSSPSQTAVQSSPGGGASPQLQAASSSLNTATTTTSTFTTPTSLPLASPSHAPVIKQEVAEPPEVPEVYLNEHYEENETKPDLLDQGAQGEHSLAIAGPSGMQGSLGGWDGEGDGAGYSEGYSEDPNDPEGQGGAWPSSLVTPFVAAAAAAAGGGGHSLTRRPQQQPALYRDPQQSASSDTRHLLLQTGDSDGGGGGGDGVVRTAKPLHQCPFCGMLMNHKNNMRKHIRTHTGEKPYSCVLCDYRAPRKDMVEKHVQQKHLGHPVRLPTSPPAAAASVSTSSSSSTTTAASQNHASSSSTSLGNSFT